MLYTYKIFLLLSKSKLWKNVSQDVSEESSLRVVGWLDTDGESDDTDNDASIAGAVVAAAGCLLYYDEEENEAKTTVASSVPVRFILSCESSFEPNGNLKIINLNRSYKMEVRRQTMYNVHEKCITLHRDIH